MESTLKSPIFKNSIQCKKFNTDFWTDELIESSINLNTPEVSGVIKELQLDGMLVINTVMNAPKGYRVEVANDFSLFKLHFEIAGNYGYTPNEQGAPIIQIPNFHFNIFYLPRVNGCLNYRGNPRRTFEVFFTLALVKKMAGDDFESLLSKADNAIKEGKPFLFWKEPRPISPEVGQILEEIIACPHTGHLKKTYLHAKITTLLLDILIESNGEERLSSKVILPQTDYEGLRVVEHHIMSNLKKDLPIAELAILAGFNGSKLKRDFKQVYGTTIFKYLTRLRMEKAVSLIRAEGLSVAEAAYEVGYSNPQHFTKAFKRTLGYLPSKLKK